MDEHQKAVLEQQRKLRQGAAIIEGTQDKFRQDGYSNLLNKYGTKQDNSTAYRFGVEPFVDDMELTTLYEGNGLFAKIIDRPSEEAVKHGLDIDFGDEDIAEYVEDRLDELEFEEKFATAEKWARLYGGSIIVMLVNDGGTLDKPLDWNKATRVDELMVFERGVVQPDYASMYHYSKYPAVNPQRKGFGQPEFYHVYGIYTSFRVHWTRCLPFRNGKLPERTMSAEYRFWGMPEYVKIKRALRECITSHEDSVKLLERSVQAIYSMKGLANMLATDAGEDKVLQRLQVIDMARGILNSIAIDTDGEQYRYENLSLTGIKEVIDATCNMLSAVTDIPQTILFGRSPAGMNSTGESDSENYYNMVENIQKQNMKANVRMLIDLILKQGAADGSIKKIPKYKVKFAALWSMTEAEQVNVDKTKADTELVKAQTAQAYMETNVLDPQEVRNTLAKEGTFEIQEVIEDNDLSLADDTFDIGIDTPITIGGTDGDFSTMDAVNKAWKKERGEDDTVTVLGIDNEVEDKVDGDKVAETNYEMIHLHEDAAEPVDGFPAAAVLVIKDGRVLCASRTNGEGLCGPGGKAEDFDESIEAVAIREAQEEFGITPLNLIPLGDYNASSGLYLNSKVFFTDEFTGEPQADGEEMHRARWLSMEELRKLPLFPPFEASLDMLGNFLKNCLTSGETTDTIKSEKQDGGPGSGRYPKGSGKNPRAGRKTSKKSLPISEKERTKVGHDINNLYYSKYEGKKNCMIHTRSNEADSPFYTYRFVNNGFDDYDIYFKGKSKS